MVYSLKRSRELYLKQACVHFLAAMNSILTLMKWKDSIYVGPDAEESICDDAGENELNMVNTFDQDNKNHGKGKVFVHLATAGKQEFYSPLGEPDLKDLPSFAHQISQGMVCIQKHVIRRPLISMHAFV